MSIKINIDKLNNEQRDKINDELRINLGTKYIFPYNIENDDIYIPFAFAVNDMKLKRDDRKSYPQMNVNFEGNLRDEQKEVKKEAIDILNKNGSVILSMYTGCGKTITSINIACTIKLKTLIIVNKIVLIKQWKDSIINFCPASKIQELNTKSKFDEDSDFFIMNAINVPKMKNNFFKAIGTCIIDECLPGNTPILTHNGYSTIKYIHDNHNKKIQYVKTFNEITKEFENKKVINVKKTLLNRNMVNISFYSGTRKIRSTDNHRFLTDKGYLYAHQLRPNDLILSYTLKYDSGDISKCLNQDQIQIVLGSFLGDGNIDILKSNRYRLRVNHGEDQKNYCEWKASMFDSKIRRIEENGYSKKPAYGFQTKFFDFNNIFPKKKDVCPQWIIDNINEKGLAIWYMDDGTFFKNGNGIKFFTNSFTEESVYRLIKRLKDFGIYGNLMKDKNKPIICLNNENTNIFIKLIAPYLHNSMEYKFICDNFLKYKEDQQKSTDDIYNKKEYIPKNKLIINNIYKIKITDKITLYKWKNCKKCDTNTFHIIHEKKNDKIYWKCSHSNMIKIYDWNINNFCSYNWDNKFLNYGYLKIKNIETDVNPKEKYVYDIEVEDNHNFIICSKTGLNGPIAHNCHLIMAESLSKSLLTICPRYLIGLSATPYREDGLDKLLDFYFGSIKIIREMFRKHIVYKVSSNLDIPIETTDNGRVNWNAVLKKQTECKERNELIIKIVKHFKDKNFLVLSKRVEQATYLFNRLKEEGEYVTSLIGKQQTFDKEARILVGITTKCGTGFDHPKLNALVLASDLDSYFIQALGRIFRVKDTVPIVFDIVDNNFILQKHYKNRLETYRTTGGKIINFEKEF